MSAPQSIINLVENFRDNEKEYKNPKTTEEQTKVKLITPFFKALGWDVENEQNLPLRYQEVEFETQVKEGKKTKNVDYSFRLEGSPIFFVEAKKPSRNLATDKNHARQARLYGWNAEIPICILTDFEEFVVYDTTFKTTLHDNAKVGRLDYYKYTDYIDKWDEIYNRFSKEAVQTGKFDKYTKERVHDPKGHKRVDDEFLKEIEEWRLILARNIALRNPELNIESLNYAVQLIIDRIIFLRIAEARGIEREGRLLDLLKTENIYKNFAKICEKADAKYNSGLFHFSPDNNADLTTDTFTLNLKIDNDVFKKIFKNLYPPHSPYEFSIISTEILGKIYEQFLGKIIRLTEGHHAKIEYKPEVKKAGGVYYTPQYIVDYIIDNTLGEKIKGKTPNQISKIRVIDPACGSGSFLIRAYQKLLDHHLDYYIQDKKPPKDVIYEGKDGKPRLTITEKKRILINNIYGVDIDTSAVEVTKLSLLLKVLEDQNKDLLEAQQKLIQERVLPNLSNNIKNGNSLIESNIIEQQKLNTKDIKEIKPFDWKEEFPEILKEGGFDVVLGNPPYFNVDTWGINSKQKEYIKENYKEVWNDKTDILFYFIKKASDLTKDKFGYIVSNAFLFAAKADKLRNYILEDISLYKIVNFEKYRVFEDADITTCIILGDKNENTEVLALGLPEKNYEIKKLKKILKTEENYFSLELNKEDTFPIKTNDIMLLNQKIDVEKSKIGDIIHIGQGMQTGANSVFLFKEYPEEFPKEYIKKRVNVSNIEQYYLEDNKEYLLYVENCNNFKDLPIIIQNYLKENSKQLKNRADVKRRKTRPWWNFTFALHSEYYSLARIYTNYRNKENKFALDEEKNYIGLTNTTVLFDTNDDFDIKYLLALLNSNVLNFRYKSIGKQTGNGSYEYFENGISKLPIPKIPLNEQQPFVELVDRITELKINLNSVNTPIERKLLQKEIDIINKKINELVYELYNITQEEIILIEENI